MQQRQENAIHNSSNGSRGIVQRLPSGLANWRKSMIGSQTKTNARSKFRDRILLLVAALSVCVIGGGVVLAFEIYHINLKWFFFAWSSIFLLPLVGKEFRSYFRQPAFVAFFTVWMCIHGATVVGMIRWTPVVAWPLILVAELAAGFIAAHWLFGFPLHQKRQKE